MYSQFSDTAELAEGHDNLPPSGRRANFEVEDKAQPPKPPRTSAAVAANTSSSPASIQSNYFSTFAASPGHLVKLIIIFAVILVVVVCLTIANLVLVTQTRSFVFGSDFDKRVEKSIFGMSKTATAKLRGYCDLFYLESCFFAIQHGPMEYIDADNACKAKEASPANIYDKTHFMMVGAYLKKIRLGNRNFVWLGMTTKQQIGKSFYRNGTEVTDGMQWFEAGGYPINKTEFDQIGFHFDFDMKYNGFINKKPNDRSVHGALCELTDN